MQEKHTTIIAIICVAIGLTLMYFTLPEKFEEFNIKIKGTVYDVEEKEKITIITFKTKDNLKAITFDNTQLQKGDEIQITGKLQEYNGKIEIVADQIITK